MVLFTTFSVGGGTDGDYWEGKGSVEEELQQWFVRG
jgi:hypothetical protein